MYANGQGITMDAIRAYMWFILAAEKGDVDAMKYRDTLSRRMTPQQLNEARDQASACQARNFSGCD